MYMYTCTNVLVLKIYTITQNVYTCTCIPNLLDIHACTCTNLCVHCTLHMYLCWMIFSCSFIHVSKFPCLCSRSLSRSLTSVSIWCSLFSSLRVHVLMRDERRKEERSKQGQTNNNVHVYVNTELIVSLFIRCTGAL